jgi:sugar lactone lactonase YvrE
MSMIALAASQFKSVRSPIAVSLTALCLIALTAGGFATAADSNCPTGLPNGYRVDANWPQLPTGRSFGPVSAVNVDSHGAIWVADRCGGNSCAKSDLAPIFKFDSSGKVLANIGAGLFVQPHSLTVDDQGNVWVADDQADGGKGQQVTKLSPDGKVLLKLGKAGTATSELTGFDQPTAIAVATNGDVYVSEGHGPTNGNSRIMKFSASGKFLKSWGTKGTGSGQFMGPHGLALDSRGRLFVADRGNARVLVYSKDGKQLAEWKQFGSAGGLFIDKHDVLYVADSSSSDATNPGCGRGIWVADARTGKASHFIPDPSPPPSMTGIGTSAAEGVAADLSGAVYGAEVYSKDVKRYVSDKP